MKGTATGRDCCSSGIRESSNFSASGAEVSPKNEKAETPLDLAVLHLGWQMQGDHKEFCERWEDPIPSVEGPRGKRGETPPRRKVRLQRISSHDGLASSLTDQ